MSVALCQASAPELPQLLLGLARIGYCGTITAQALSSLVAHAKEHGVDVVLGWVRADPGLLFVPSWQFWLPLIPRSDRIANVPIVAPEPS